MFFIHLTGFLRSFFTRQVKTTCLTPNPDTTTLSISPSLSTIDLWRQLLPLRSNSMFGRWPTLVSKTCPADWICNHMSGISIVWSVLLFLTSRRYPEHGYELWRYRNKYNSDEGRLCLHYWIVIFVQRCSWFRARVSPSVGPGFGVTLAGHTAYKAS